MCEEVVQFYEFVFMNIEHILPFLAAAFEIELIANKTAHSLGLVPLLGFHFDASKNEVVHVDVIQRADDN